MTEKVKGKGTKRKPFDLTFDCTFVDLSRDSSKLTAVPLWDKKGDSLVHSLEVLFKQVPGLEVEGGSNDDAIKTWNRTTLNF